MKNILNVMLLAILGAGMLASCDEDRDSNPVFNSKASELVLNTPANAVNVYDLENSKYLVLTTAQPDYGITAAVTYTPYISVFGSDFMPLPTTYTTTTLQIPAQEVNNAILDLAGDNSLDAPVEVKFKISSQLTGVPELGELESNAVSLPQVLAFVPKVEVSLPSALYIVGGFPASGWGTFPALHQGYSQDGFFYGIVYLQNGNTFRFSTKAGDWGATFGLSTITREGDVANALEDANSDDNYLFSGQSGLYTVVMKAKIANGSVAYTMSMSPARIYLFGAAGSDLWEWSDANLFADNGDGTATSPALTGNGELRIAVDCGIDWWKTEFTVMNTNGNLYYRDCDIPNNWAENVGADYSFQAAAGKTITLDFGVEPGMGVMK